MPNQTPLSEPDPRSIDELLAADPLSLSDDDVDKIVAEHRENRALWAKEDSAAQAEGRKRKKVYKPVQGKLSLADLGLMTKKPEPKE